VSEFDQVIAMGFSRRIAVSPSHFAQAQELHALRQQDFIV
jgi:hypothetical protein